MTQSLSTATHGNTTLSDAELALRNVLYADIGSLMTGMLLTICVAVIFWLVSGETAPLLIGGLNLTIAGVRVLIASQSKWQNKNWFWSVFAGSSVAYLLCIDAITYWAVGSERDPSIVALVIFVVSINTISIAFRSFTSQKLVTLQICAIVIPTAATFIMRGGAFYAAALIQILSAYYVPACATRLRNLFRSEMAFRNRSETVAAQFRFAIDNMSHGMCMIDADMRIAVVNPQLAQVLGLTGRQTLQGADFRALVRLARRVGALDEAAAEQFDSSLAASGAHDGVARIEVNGLDGRVIDVSIKRNEEGGWVLVAQDITEQRRAREALDHAARFDAMTGLPNRAEFESRLADSLRASQGLDRRTEVIFFDLDRFKQVNDTMGHKTGDRVLAETANRLSQSVGPDGFAARWGGDEFVVLRWGTDDAAVVRFAEKLIGELSRPIWIEGAEVSVGASAGVSACCDGFTSTQTLLQQADMALYAAKREMRGACRLFEAGMNEKARERRLLELDLQAALAARSFELRYQPIVDLDTGDLVNFEALAQWRHPTRGSVSPVVFVPALEEMNLMHAFGAWSLQRACEDAVSWPQPVRVGVNVSAKQISTLLDTVRRALASSGLAPERLELEITETAALEGGDECRSVLEAVRALGVRIALDDFGTGYSSLSHLMSLPLDKVKIDKGFTQQLGISRKADLLVANIARLSSQLGMCVTYEGIETVEQLERVRAVGVAAEGQGWLFGRPTYNSELGRFFTAKENKQAVA